MLPNQSFIFPGSYLRVPGLCTESQWLEIPEIFILHVHIYSSKWLPLLLCLLVRFNNTLWELSPRLCPPRLCVWQITGIVFFWFLLIRDVILLSESRVCVMTVCVSCPILALKEERVPTNWKSKRHHLIQVLVDMWISSTHSRYLNTTSLLVLLFLLVSDIEMWIQTWSHPLG